MLSGRMFKPLLFTAVLSASLFTIACQSPEAVTTAESTENSAWPTLAERLACMPKEASLVAAHRGTSRGKSLTENSIESLEALYKGDIRLAEIDVAQLRSGEHVLFHDGVWEEKSTGRGAVAQSRWGDVQDYLLRDTEGRVSSARPPKFEDVLQYAKGRLHLEIDFKSSADYDGVVKMIRAAAMEDDVVLIAYSTGQAKALAKRAPEMFISVSAKKRADIKALEKSGVKRSQMMVWVGKSQNVDFMKYLKAQNITVLTQEAGRRAAYTEADVFVSDYALNKNIFEGAIGLSKKSKAAYQSCLFGH